MRPNLYLGFVYDGRNGTIACIDMLTAHSCRLIRTPWPGVFGTDVESGREYDRHWHTTYGIGFMARGAHRSLSGRGIVDAYAGDVITCNPGEVHDGRPLSGPSRRWRMIYMEPAVMASMRSDAGAAPSDVQLTRPVIRDRKLLGILRRLLDRLGRCSGASPHSAQTLACEELLVLACGLAFREHSNARAAREAPGDVRRVCERLTDDIASSPSLGELAALTGLSKYQVLRRFERTYGMTPHAWLRQVRLERARASIQRGTSLAAAAAENGFSDQSHLTRAFVAHFGFTPGACAPQPRSRLSARAAAQ